MSKFLNIMAPALGGTALVLGTAYYTAYVMNAPEPLASLPEATAPAETETAVVAAQDAEIAEPVTLATDGEAAKAPTVMASGESFGLGRAATADEVAAWDLDVSPDGTGLPVGSGDVFTGEELFSDNCASCHGEFAEGVDNWPKLAGGDDTLADKDPVKTVGSYWPYLSTAWDYVHRSMPFGNAQSLSVDETYAIVAYILYSNDLVDDEFVLSNDNFLEVEMPNKAGFIEDDRETTEAHFWNAEPCMENCKESVEITMRAMVLDVTPEDEGAEEEAAAEPATEEVVQTAAAAPAETEPEAAPVEEPVAVAAVDPELVSKGEKVFKKCKACHQVGDGAQNKTGPILTGIVGSPAGAVEGFKYSDAMQDAASAGLVWTSEELSAFLVKPKDYMKGTKMSFAGLKKETDQAAIIAYLQSFAGN